MPVWAKAEKTNDTFTVYQMNLWHEGSKVPNGYQGILDVLDEVDADVVFYVKSEISTGRCSCPGFWRIWKSGGSIIMGRLWEWLSVF